MVSEQQCCQNLDFSYILLENFAKTMEGPKKNQSFGAKTLESTNKTKNQSVGVLSGQLPNAPKIFFGTLQRFGTKTLVFLVASMKRLEGSQRTKFWCQNAGGYQKNKKQSFGALGSCSSRLQNFVFLFFGTLQRFGTKTLVFLGPLKVLGAF